MGHRNRVHETGAVPPDADWDAVVQRRAGGWGGRSDEERVGRAGWGWGSTWSFIRTEDVGPHARDRTKKTHPSVRVVRGARMHTYPHATTSHNRPKNTRTDTAALPEKHSSSSGETCAAGSILRGRACATQLSTPTVLRVPFLSGNAAVRGAHRACVCGRYGATHVRSDAANARPSSVALTGVGAYCVRWVRGKGQTEAGGVDVYRTHNSTTMSQESAGPS